VRVVFSDRVKLELDLLFGCEGIHSRVRNRYWGSRRCFTPAGRSGLGGGARVCYRLTWFVSTGVAAFSSAPTRSATVHIRCWAAE
jgi:2-polyprenyl-6-methoxyphenol hydroxylase-like FAD-dependent oxidoreductase